MLMQRPGTAPGSLKPPLTLTAPGRLRAASMSYATADGRVAPAAGSAVAAVLAAPPQRAQGGGGGEAAASPTGGQPAAARGVAGGSVILIGVGEDRRLAARQQSPVQSPRHPPRPELPLSSPSSPLPPRPQSRQRDRYVLLGQSESDGPLPRRGKPPVPTATHSVQPGGWLAGVGGRWTDTMLFNARQTWVRRHAT